MDRLKTSPSLTDGELIHAIRSGGLSGDKAIMTVYTLYRKDVRSYIRMISSKYHYFQLDADDILHDSFITMLYKIQNESPVIISIKSYWSGIAKNAWLNQAKRNKKCSLVEEPAECYGLYDHTPESIILNNERYRRIENYLCKCGGRCREILLLWLSDYTMQEIADKLNLSGPAMARKLKHECFKKFKNLVANTNIFTAK
jgi:RNA polymerase sigma factor (sigma-70 family)